STADAMDMSKGDSNPETDEKAEVDGTTKNDQAEGDNEEEAVDGPSPQAPRRMTTRAQVNQGTNSQNQESTYSATPSLSGTLQSSSDADSLPTEPHPLFLLPKALSFDRNCGVPQQDAD